MGPIKSSLGGCRYILTYICSHIEYSDVYLLKHKSEQASYFKEYRAKYEKEQDLKIKELRSDNGLEYFSNEFQNYLRQAGIERLTSVAYAPQSNGKAERLNRTLLDKARTMLATSGLNINIWGSAIFTANYLRNRSPCKPINFKSPYELKYNKLPALSHLKVFGCDAYPLIVDKKQRKKFLPTALANCVFVGYDERDGIYWIYNMSNRQIFRSRDVKFHENNSRKVNNSENSEEWFTMDYSTIQPSEESLSDNTEGDGKGEGEGEDDNNEEPTNDNPEAASATSVKQKRTSSRASKKPERLEVNPKSKSYTVRLNSDEPRNMNEVLNSPDKKKWMEAIKSELESIKENKVWSVVKRPNDKSIIQTRWIFKIKRNADNKPEKYKARLVAKGYCQEYGIDYYETFAPVVKVQTLRTIFALSAQQDMIVHQVDIHTAFLNGDLEEPGTNL